jgi:hypothetical protein
MGTFQTTDFSYVVVSGPVSLALALAADGGKVTAALGSSRSISSVKAGWPG